MNKPAGEKFDASTILGGLKDFQRATVDHAMSRLYTGEDPASKFLVPTKLASEKRSSPVV